MPSSKLYGAMSLVAGALLAALLISVPVNCFCDADQHLGHAVHSRLPHVHPTGESAYGMADTGEASFGVASISAGAAAALVLLVADGLFQDRAVLAGALLLLGFVSIVPRRRPAEYLCSPPTAPPRLSLLALP